jgi:hypothetical protein
LKKNICCGSLRILPTNQLVTQDNDMYPTPVINAPPQTGVENILPWCWMQQQSDLLLGSKLVAAAALRKSTM